VQEYGEDQSFLRPNGSEPWHVFLPSWYKFYCVLVRSRYKFDWSRVFIPGYKFGGSTGPEYSGRYKLSRSQITVTVKDLNCEQMSVSGYMNHYKFVLGAGANKNRDKLIDPTVRVMRSDLFV